jgi:tellurite resistance protein
MLHEVIQSLRPGKEFTMFDDDPSTIIWNDPEVTTPSESEIKSATTKYLANQEKEAKAKEATKAALLEKLGITAEEAVLLLS